VFRRRGWIAWGMLHAWEKWEMRKFFNWVQISGWY
jgi:hypothetical protein